MIELALALMPEISRALARGDDETALRLLDVLLEDAELAQVALDELR